MSPLTLRRYRAERLLRAEFEGLRGRVTAAVRGRLGASGASLDPSDLDACYSQAWQGLYAAVLDGQEIANPTGWLTLVTFRRAIEELRARRFVQHPATMPDARGGRIAGRSATAHEGGAEPDFAAELDDRIRLRQLFEAMRGRLSAREREAATLCYLQGLSRSQAAARMGISEARMRKLMDGQGVGRPGVAHKLGALAETVQAGGWCEQQASLMRGLAFGILDPDGERYRLALIHRGECPACRAYVLSLRGLAAVLPPVLLPWGLAAGALTRAAAGSHARAGIGGGMGPHPPAAGQVGAPVGAGTAGQAGAGIGGALSASGAAGAGGAAGGSWLWAGGPLAAKVAVGCLLALGVGAGCVAFTDVPRHARRPLHGPAASAVRADRAQHSSGTFAESPGELQPAGQHVNASATAGGGALPAFTAAERAAREFGPEQGSVAVEPRLAFPAPGGSSRARSASSEHDRAKAPQAFREGSTSAAASAAPPPPQSSPPAARQATAGGGSAAEREFGIE